MKYLLILVILLSACETAVSTFNSDLLPGNWLGGGYRLDNGVYKPFNRFMIIDSQLNLELFSAMWRDTLKPIEVRLDSILFPFRPYPRGAVKVSKEELSLGIRYPFLYKKVQPSIIDRDSSEIKEELIGGQWGNEKQVLEFKDDSLVAYDIKTKTKEVFCWDIYNYNGIKFLQKKGNFMECELPFEALSIIHNLGNDTLEIEMWYNNAFKKLTYKKGNFETVSYSIPEFQLCDPYLYENYSVDWYYFKYARYEDGLYKLKKIFDESFKVVKGGSVNGLVKLKFVINCAGQVGNISMQTMDHDYKRKKLNSQVSGQILEIFKGAGNWIPAEHRGRKVDAYKFLIFRIKDGAIDEIFP